MGGNPGSRASTEPVPVSALTGIDPGRISDLLEGCGVLASRLEVTKSFHCCEDVGQLESYHDNLADCVRDLNGMLRLTLQAIQGANQ